MFLIISILKYLEKTSCILDPTCDVRTRYTKYSWFDFIVYSKKWETYESRHYLDMLEGIFSFTCHKDNPQNKWYANLYKRNLRIYNFHIASISAPMVRTLLMFTQIGQIGMTCWTGHIQSYMLFYDMSQLWAWIESYTTTII